MKNGKKSKIAAATEDENVEADLNLPKLPAFSNARASSSTTCFISCNDLVPAMLFFRFSFRLSLLSSTTVAVFSSRLSESFDFDEDLSDRSHASDMLLSDADFTISEKSKERF